MENKDWTDVLYILVAVVFGIIGKLAQRRNKAVSKKKVVSQPEEIVVDESAQQSRKSKSESFFDTIFESVFEEETSTSVVEESGKEIDLVEKTKKETQAQSVSELKGLDALLKKRHDEELEEEAERNRIRFDLRQAVVYSEILNRKYR